MGSERNLYKKCVSMIGALPPLKGNAYYCMGLAREMSQRIKVDFIAFKKLYPEFLYPGGVSDDDEKFKISETETLSIRRIIAYYNPLSWIYAGWAVRSRIVHIQWWSMPIAPIYLVLLLVLKARQKRIIFTVHNVTPHEPSAVDKILTNSAFYFSDAFIVHSSSSRDSLIRRFNLPNNVVHEVHMPVHDMYGGNGFSQKQARKEIGIPENAKVILSFGNLREYKGIDRLIAALPTVIRHVPKTHLLIVGQPWTKWGRYEKLIKELKLETKITAVLKYVPMSEVKKYFSVSTLVALPYKQFDAQSGVGNIALAFGLPLVVSRVGGLPDLVKDKRAIVEPDDIASLADGISRILLDEKLYRKLCDDAEALRQQYSWSAAIDSTLSIYREVLTKDG
jgi:glycosyltransferase involved in cell wall biosynthesis